MHRIRRAAEVTQGDGNDLYDRARTLGTLLAEDAITLNQAREDVEAIVDNTLPPTLEEPKDCAAAIKGDEGFLTHMLRENGTLVAENVYTLTEFKGASAPGVQADVFLHLSRHARKKAVTAEDERGLLPSGVVLDTPGAKSKVAFFFTSAGWRVFTCEVSKEGNSAHALEEDYRMFLLLDKAAQIMETLESPPSTLAARVTTHRNAP